MRNRTTAAALGLATVSALLTGCSSDKPQPRPGITRTTPAHTTTTPTASPKKTSSGHQASGPAACRSAIKAQYQAGTAILTGAPTQPPACAGLSSDQISQIVLDVIQENTGG